MKYNEVIVTVCKLMQTTESKLAKASGRVFALHSLTASQVNVLFLLDSNGAMKISDIASKLSMTESNVSNICTRLEKAGFTCRNRLESDRRVVKTDLTDKAKKRMGDIKTAVSDLYNKMQPLINEKDWEDILVGLTKMNTLLDLYFENTKTE